MKRLSSLAVFCFLLMAVSQCSSNEPQAPEQSKSVSSEENRSEEQEAKEQSKSESKEIPEIQEIDISATIDQKMALAGAEVFSAKCTMCHKPSENFIGPAAAGVLERRTPDWLMKMIMYPDLMQEQDIVVQKLIEEYNGAVMPNQNITFEEARSILEYYRTL